MGTGVYESVISTEERQTNADSQQTGVGAEADRRRLIQPRYLLQQKEGCGQINCKTQERQPTVILLLGLWLGLKLR